MAKPLLPDDLWDQIEPLLPRVGRIRKVGGPPGTTHIFRKRGRSGKVIVKALIPPTTMVR